MFTEKIKDGYCNTKLKLTMSDDNIQEPKNSCTSHVQYTTLQTPSVEMPQNRSPNPNASPNLFYASTSYEEASCSR